MLALYLVYHEVSVAGSIQLKFFMMPMMNALIASVLFYYTKKLSATARSAQLAKSKRNYIPPEFRVTLYDMLGFAFIAILVAIIIVWMF